MKVSRKTMKYLWDQYELGAFKVELGKGVVHLRFLLDGEILIYCLVTDGGSDPVSRVVKINGIEWPVPPMFVHSTNGATLDSISYGGEEADYHDLPSFSRARRKLFKAAKTYLKKEKTI